MPNGRGEVKYTAYTTRSQKTRNPERISHGKVARKRYKMIDHSDPFEPVGHGRITGHQKRTPDIRNDACSIPCHISDRSPSANNDGMCHPMSAQVAASQQSVGFTSIFPSRCMAAQRKTGARNPTNR